jgi:cell wall-associated NlpC family hydrolase
VITRADVVSEGLTWLGTPWLHQARLKGIGADCIGFIGGVAVALGIRGASEWARAPEFHNYGPQPQAKLMLAGCARFLDPIALADVQLADVLMLRFERDPMHFALVSRVAPLYVLHALSTAGKVTEHRVDATWANRIVRAWRFRGLT